MIGVRELARVQQRSRVGVGGISAASLEQQNRPRRVLAQAGRQDRAGRATADDKYVSGLGQVGHLNLLVSVVREPGAGPV